MGKWNIKLSTTEPHNYVGLIKVRQGNRDSEILKVVITENGVIKDLSNMKIYFNTVINGNPIEKKATLVNGKRGEIKFVLDDYSMQETGKQQAYFSFKTADDVFIDGTQNFYYSIQTSTSKSITDKGPFLASVDEIREEAQLISDEVKELSEGLKPEAAVGLANQISDLKDISAIKSDITFNDITQTLSNINQKVVLKIKEDEYQIFTRQRTRGEYCLFKLTKGTGDTSSASIGKDFDLLRLVSVFSVKDIIVFNQPEIFTSSQNKSHGVNDFSLKSFTTGYESPVKRNYISNVNNEAQGSFLEFTTVVTKAHKGKINLGFYGTPNTNKKLSIYINGVLTDTVDTSSPTPKTVFFSVNAGSRTGEVTIRLQTANDATANGGVHFLGVDAIDLKELDYNFKMNGLLYNWNTGNHYISQTTGANDYALLENDSGKWSGSFHGGEKAESILMNVDGISILDMIDGEYKLGKSLKIIQMTTIIDKISAQSITEIVNDGIISFECRFEIKTPFQVKNFYPAMTCTNDTFKEVLFPRRAVAGTSNSLIKLPNSKKVTQMNLTTGQSVTTLYTPLTDYTGDTPLAIRYSANLYSKIYHGLAVDSLRKLESLNFGSVKIFD